MPMDSSDSDKRDYRCILDTHPELNECCCYCKYRVRTFAQGTGEQIGWACIAFVFKEGEDIVFVGDFKHGICELFSPKEKSND